MKNSKEQYVLSKTFISDNGIDRIFRPVLEQGEYERRKTLLVKSCIHMMREQEIKQKEIL